MPWIPERVPSCLAHRCSSDRLLNDIFVFFARTEESILRAQCSVSHVRCICGQTHRRTQKKGSRRAGDLYRELILPSSHPPALCTKSSHCPRRILKEGRCSPVPPRPPAQDRLWPGDLVAAVHSPGALPSPGRLPYAFRTSGSH